jgi:FKBP-type peptidyl-prolyl cis-trans isomerase
MSNRMQNGMEVRDSKTGKGMEVRAMDMVEVHYTGTLSDGKVFDSSRPRKETFKFQVGAGMVISGWDFGLLGMKLGGVRDLVIPPDMAYGKRGVPGVIPPDSVLNFNIELIKILPRIKLTRSGVGTGEGAKFGDEVTGTTTFKLASGKLLSDKDVEVKVSLDGRTLPGLNQMLHGAKVGESLVAVIPHELAYGEKGVYQNDKAIVPKRASIIVEMKVSKVTVVPR